MSMTRDDYLTYIKLTLKREDKDTELVYALDDVLFELTTMYDFQVQQTETEFTVLDDTYEYTYPVGYAVLIGNVRYIDSGGCGRALNKLSKEDFDDKYPDLKESNFSKGDAYDYTIYNNNIYIAPYPETANGEKFYISGSTIADQLTLTTSEPNFKDRWREIIKFGVLYRIYSDLEEDQKASKYKGLFEQGINRMIERDQEKDNGITICEPNII